MNPFNQPVNPVFQVVKRIMKRMRSSPMRRMTRKYAPSTGCRDSDNAKGPHAPPRARAHVDPNACHERRQPATATASRAHATPASRSLARALAFVRLLSWRHSAFSPRARLCDPSRCLHAAVALRYTPYAFCGGAVNGAWSLGLPSGVAARLRQGLASVSVLCVLRGFTVGRAWSAS